MKNQKIYAGASLKELRQKSEMTQREFATALDVSVSYLNQMENNNRPIPAAVILRLARDFELDLATMGGADQVRLVADLHEAFADPVITTKPKPADLQLLAGNAPLLARAVLDLHRAYLTGQERLSSFNDALGTSASNPHPQPWEEVRDFFHYCDNYIDAIDVAAERLSAQYASTELSPLGALRKALSSHGVEIKFDGGTSLRAFDANAHTLIISENYDTPTQLFQIAVQLGLLSSGDLFDATLDLAHFQSQEAREICRIGLANYFAGAYLMPYENFLTCANELRHDLEALARHFSCSIEQVAHRLSTLQRPSRKGIPFFFVRVDQAGTITKRHSATRLQFARFGGACPLWNVHRAFETPGQFLRQFAETPDGVRYFCLARDVSKSGGSFGAPTRRYAIGLGCEIEHASKLVYADDLDAKNPKAFEPIGVSCRICPRPNCHQRAVPPHDAKMLVDENARGVQAYAIE